MSDDTARGRLSAGPYRNRLAAHPDEAAGGAMRIVPTATGTHVQVSVPMKPPATGFVAAVRNRSSRYCRIGLPPCVTEAARHSGIATPPPRGATEIGARVTLDCIPFSVGTAVLVFVFVVSAGFRRAGYRQR